MENRNAWRLLDFAKDVLMHHRKFTPFQKIVVLSVLVGVILCLLRNWWFLMVTFTYGLTVYASVVVSKYIIQRNVYFSSDLVLIWLEWVEHFVAVLFENIMQNDDLENNRTMDTNQNTHNGGEIKTDHETDEFFDACDTLPEEVMKSITKTGQGDLDINKRKRSKSLTVGNREGRVDLEIEDIKNLVHRDFIKSWYSLFSKNEGGLSEAELILHNIFDNIQGRLCRANVLKIAKFIMMMFRNHVHDVKQAQMMFKLQKRKRRSSVKPLSSKSVPGKSYKSLEECYASKVELHPAVKSTELEQSYQKSILELLVLHVLPKDLHQSKSVVCALKEIVMCNVLQKVMSLLSDTTFLHERIIVITSEEQPGMCMENTPIICITGSTDSIENNVPSILVRKNASHDKGDKKDGKTSDVKLITPDVKSEDVDTRKRSESATTLYFDARWNDDTKLHPVSKSLCNECNRLCSMDKDRISPRPHTCILGISQAFLDSNSDSDRLSVNSLSSREGSPVFQLYDDSEKPDSGTISDIPSGAAEMINTQTIHSSMSDIATDKSKPSQIKDHSPDTVEQRDEKAGKSDTAKDFDKSLTPTEDKSSSGTFFSNMTFQFPNPITSISNFRKRASTTGLSDRKTSSSNLEDISEIANEKADLRRSLSTGEILKPGPVTPTTPVEIAPWPTNEPSIFQDVAIVDTETAVEAGGTKNRYTLYVLQYEALYPSDVDADLVHKTGTVKRRFREFVNLQIRLEDNPAYKKSMRDIKGPKKILPPFPFGNMSRETLDNRRKLLETFISSLLKHEDICNGEELKQFLGYSGDGHIAFVRKMSESSGPRIDQRLVKTMSGVFDKIVEQLPSLPQQLPRIITPFEDVRSDKENDIKPLNDTDLIEVEFVFGQVQKLSQKAESALDKFIDMTTENLVEDEDSETQNDTTLGVNILEWQEQQAVSPSHMTISSHLTIEEGTNTDGEGVPLPDEGPSTSEEMALSNAVLDILAELLYGQDHWMCRDNVIQMTKILFGKGLNRYLQTKVEFLTSCEMNTFYLHTLRETVWPGGVLSEESRPTFTDHQKEILRKQATRCLKEFLPGLLRKLLGQEDFDHIIEEVMETIQYEKLNRHFWYTALDVVLEEIVPELSSPEFQRKLSASLGK